MFCRKKTVTECFRTQLRALLALKMECWRRPVAVQCQFIGVARSRLTNRPACTDCNLKIHPVRRCRILLQSPSWCSQNPQKNSKSSPA